MTKTLDFLKRNPIPEEAPEWFLKEVEQQKQNWDPSWGPFEHESWEDMQEEAKVHMMRELGPYYEQEFTNPNALMMPPVGPVELPPGILGLMEPSMALSVPPPAGTSIDGRVITQEDIDTYNFTRAGRPYPPGIAPMTPALLEAERLTEMQARGIDPRMARSYQENIRLMGDPRMLPPMPMGGTPIDVMPPLSDPYEGLSGQEYAEKYGIPYAKGGRASLSKGGLSKILGV